VVTLAALEVIAVDSGRGFHTADDRFDRGAALHLAADRSGHPPHLAGDPDAEFVGMIVAAMPYKEPSGEWGSARRGRPDGFSL